MTENQFATQMQRLESQFGKFGKERASILWKEIRDCDGQWFERVVDEFVGDLRQMPLMPDFRDRIAKERERNYRDTKKQHETESKEWASVFHPDEISSICQQTIQKLKGNISENDFECFKNLLKGNTYVNCKVCQDEGIYFDPESKGMTVCSCRQSRR